MKKISIISFVIMVLLVFSANTALGEMQEYGRKPYIAKTYHDMMTKKTNRAAWNVALVKQSEFEKPYISDTYEEMQYYFPVFPGLSFDIYDFDFENIVPYAPFDPYNPWLVVFYCSGSPCYCPGETKCFSMGCTYPIVGIETTWNYSCGGLSFEIGNGQLCVTANSNPDTFCNIDIIMQARVSTGKGQYTLVVGAHENFDISECGDCCVDDASMAWDYGASAETIGQSDSVSIAITGNNKPFSWSVSGTDFTLADAETTGLGNTLIAGANACGSATITVTGCDGGQATGYVRCTANSQWSYIGSGECVLPGSPDSATPNAGGGLDMVRIQGMTKMEQNFDGGGRVNFSNGCANSDPCRYFNTLWCLTWACEDVGQVDCPGVDEFCCKGSAPDCEHAYNYCFHNTHINRYSWICQ